VNIPSVARRSAVKNDPVEVALVNDAVTALKNEVKKLDDVALVVDAFVAKKLVVVLLVVDALVAAKLLVAVALVTVKLLIVPVLDVSEEMVAEADVRSLIVPLVIVVVANTDVPVAVSVPVVRLEEEALPSVEVPEVSVVIVALVAVRLVKKPDTDVRIDAKRLDEVALVVDALVAKKLVAVALVNTDDEPLRLANVPVVLVRVVIVLDDEVKSLIVALVMVVVARVTVPVAVRVLVVSETKVGVVDTLMVEVPVRLMLDPAVK
jgi:hypothetical protein